jgi:hypothetical protein
MHLRCRRCDYRNTIADEISHQRRKAIVLAIQQVLFDCHVLALDVTGFSKAFAERCHTNRERTQRPEAATATAAPALPMATPRPRQATR